MIKICKPYLQFEEIEFDFRNIFNSGWFTKGKYVHKFRNILKESTRAEYAHLTTSATTALMMSLRVYGISQDDEVILSDFSFPATVNVVEDIGAAPIFADVELDSFNMNPEELKRKITSKTKAVIFVDALGNPSGIHDIKQICQEHGLPLIEDAACAIGSSENNVKCGKISDITCFSFHPRKLLTTGEGGAILTDSKTINDFLDLKLNHGSLLKNNTNDFISYGYNYRLPELQAAMGCAQMLKLEDIIQSRNLIRQKFIDRLVPLGFVPQKVSKDAIFNVQSLVFRVPKKISRDNLIKYLRSQDIESTLGTYCLSSCTYYRNKYNCVQPISEYLQNNTITLPCHDDVNIDLICNKISTYCKNY